MRYVQYYTHIMLVTTHTKEQWIHKPAHMHTDTRSLAADSNGRHEHENAHHTDTVIVKWSHKYTQQNKHRNKIIIIMEQKMYCCNERKKTVITNKNAGMWITKHMDTYTLMHTCSVATKCVHRTHTHTHTHAGKLVQRCL